MGIKEFIKPTRLKIYGLLVLMIGAVIPALISFIINMYYAQTLGPEGYQSFVSSLQTNSSFSIILLFVYLIWYYILATVIISLAKKK